MCKLAVNEDNRPKEADVTRAEELGRHNFRVGKDNVTGNKAGTTWT